MRTKRVYAVFLMSIFCVLLLSSSGDHFNLQDRWAAPSWADSISNPYMVEPLTLPLGEELYNVHCKSCHNSKNGPSSDLADEQVQKQSNGALFWKISEGRTKMPAFKETLTEEQRWQLVHYVRDIAKPFDQQENPFKGFGAKQ